MMIKLLLIDSINFFTSVGETTYQKLKQLTNECRYAPLQQTCSLEFPRAEQFILPKKQAVHCLDVEKIVSSLSTKNFIYIAPGLDEIPIRVIRLPLHCITAIINSSFTTSTYPGDWRIAEVRPVLKEGDFEQPSNNRPISLLPILSKVCEKVVLHQPTPYLKTNKRLVVEQSGKKKVALH